MTRFKVFISHTNGPEDMEIVRRIQSNLKSIEIISYIAEDDRQPGTYLVDKIKNHIKTSNLVLGLWTQDATNSAYVNQEIGLAEGINIPNFLLVEKGVPVKGFPEGREYITFDPSDSSVGLKEVEKYVGKRKLEKEDDEKWKLIITVVVTIIGIFTLIWLARKAKEEGE